MKNFTNTEGEILEMTCQKRRRSYLRLLVGCMTAFLALSFMAAPTVFAADGDEDPAVVDPVEGDDTTAPAIEVKWDNEEPVSEGYYDGSRTATITVTVENFDASLMTVTTTGTAGEWEEGYSADVHTMTVEYATDGTHSLAVSRKDLDGNEADSYNSGEFVIDTTDPVIDSLTMETPDGESDWWENVYYNGSAKLSFALTEDNVDTITLEYQHRSGYSRWKSEEVNLASNASSYTFTLGDNDDLTIKNIKLTVTDKAGHTATKSYDGDQFDIVPSETKLSLQFGDNKTLTYDQLTDDSADYVDDATPTVVVQSRFLDSNKTTVVVLDSAGNTTTYDKDDLEWEAEGRTSLKAVIKDSATAKGIIDGAAGVTVNVYTTNSSNPTVYAFGLKASETEGEPDVTSGTFVIDTVAPEISEIAWSNSASSAYYAGQRVATFTVREANVASPDSSWVHFAKGSDTTTDIVWENTAAGVYTVTVTFKNDGKYEFSVYGSDLAGNESNTVKADAFTIDATAPTISDIVWDNTDVHNDKYYDASRTATITVTETNFNKDLFTVTTGGAADYSWSDQGDAHVLTVKFTEDGDYQLTVSGQDLAGNAAVSASDNTKQIVESPAFTRDTKAPTAQLVIDASTYETFRGTKYFKDTASIDVVISEHNFKDSFITVDTDGRKGSWVTDGDTHTMTVTFSGEGDHSLKVSGKDLADNELEEKSEEFAVDKTAPKVTGVVVNQEPSATANDDDIFFYNVAATMTITVDDDYAIARASFADLSFANQINENDIIDPDDTYTAKLDLADGAKRGIITIALKEGSGSQSHPINEFQNDIVLTVWDVAGNMRTWSISPEGTVKDVSGSSTVNTSINGKQVYPSTLVQDLTAPVINVTGVTEGSYYNSDQTASISVEEYNFGYLQLFDGSRVLVTIGVTSGDASLSQSTIQILAKELTGSDPSYSISHVFDADGHYTIDAGFKDYANNESNTVHIGEFTIDKTAPVITVTWDNNDVRNGKYYNAGRTATITVVEHNFDESLFTVETAGAKSGWSTDGDTHTMTVSCTEDGGVYALTVSGSDRAGNSAEQYTEDEFVVDMTNPEITFGGQFGAHQLEQKGETEVSDATNSVAKPLITYTDKPDVKGGEPFDTYDATYELTKLDGTSAEVADVPIYDSAVSGGVYNINFEDFGYLGELNENGMIYDLEADGVYQLTAHVTDFAGNEADNAVVFSINRYGSTFIVESVYTPNEQTKEHVNEAARGIVWLAEEPSIVVRAIDVSATTDHYVTVERPDAKTPSLDEVAATRSPNNTFSGYTYETINDGSKGWYEYTYTVGSGNFGEGNGGEGAYNVTIACSDEAGNTSTAERFYNRDAQGSISSAQVAFFLDSVGPEIQIIQPEGIEIADTYDLQFQVIDEQKLTDETLELTIDGVPLDEASVQALRDEGSLVGPDSAGNYTLEIGHKTILSGRSVDITATDWIDRSATAFTETFRVTNLVAEIIAGLAVIGGGTAGFVYSRSKKNAEGSAGSKYR